jgi:hypothetical protein
MKTLKLLFLSTAILFFTACGTTESKKEIDPTRGFDMWEYMTSTLDYEVEYNVYVNNEKVSEYSEAHRFFDNEDTYERRSATDRTTLYLNSRSISMKEPSRDVEIERYVHLNDKRVFRSSSIDLCIVKDFYSTYINKNWTFEDVLMIACTSQSGVKQEFYYGHYEGIVAIYERDGDSTKEYVKVHENRI